MNTKQQRRPQYEPAKETLQEKRQRLLAGLNQPPSKLNTAREFDYHEATRIARGER